MHRRPVVLDENALIIERVEGIELAATCLEMSDLRTHDLAVSGIGPIQPPFLSLRIEQPQCQPLDVSGGAVHIQRVELRAPVPKRHAVAASIEINPLV